MSELLSIITVIEQSWHYCKTLWQRSQWLLFFRTIVRLQMLLFSFSYCGLPLTGWLPTQQPFNKQKLTHIPSTGRKRLPTRLHPALLQQIHPRRHRPRDISGPSPSPRWRRFPIQQPSRLQDPVRGTGQVRD